MYSCKEINNNKHKRNLSMNKILLSAFSFLIQVNILNVCYDNYLNNSNPFLINFNYFGLRLTSILFPQ